MHRPCSSVAHQSVMRCFRQRALLFFTSLACLPVCGVSVHQAFLNPAVTATSSPSTISSNLYYARDTYKRRSRSTSGRCKLRAAAAAVVATAAPTVEEEERGGRRRSGGNEEIRLEEASGRTFRRPRAAKAMPQGVFASVSKIPAPSGGGSYEGGKKERADKDKLDEAEFIRNVGKVIDTLRKDYPRIFEEPPDFDIYTPDLQLRDPTGIVFSGLPAYQRLFATLRFFRQILAKEILTTFRLSYDASRQQVRVTWHFVVDSTPIVARPLRLDGVSVYYLSTKGWVQKHKLETVMVNRTPVKPPLAQAWMHVSTWVPQGAKTRGTVPIPRAATFSSGGGVLGRNGFAFFSGVAEGCAGFLAKEFDWKREELSMPAAAPTTAWQRQLASSLQAWEVTQMLRRQG